MRSLPLQRPNSEQPLDPRFHAAHRDFPQSLRSVLAVSHDLDGFIRSEPRQSLLRHPLMGFFPSGFSRVTDGHTVSGAASPHDLPSQHLPPSTGTSQTRRVAGPGLQGIYPVTRPRPPASWFPIHRGRYPLGFYFLGPRFPEDSRAEARSLPGPYGPVTCSELRKSNNVLRKKLRVAPKTRKTTFRRKISNGFSSRKFKPLEDFLL